jgi:hypothetical protein
VPGFLLSVEPALRRSLAGVGMAAENRRVRVIGLTLLFFVLWGILAPCTTTRPAVGHATPTDCRESAGC